MSATFFIFSKILLTLKSKLKRITMKKLFSLLALVAGLTLLNTQAFAENLLNNPEKATKKVLVIGAHPDDPETWCGGTMILMRQAGYDVTVVYLTRGQAGIKGKSHDEAAAIRTQEALNACKVMDVRPIFMDHIDGNVEVNAERYKQIRDLIEQENPDMVFTHWPVELHRDHGACAGLVIEAWKRLKYSFELYFCEPMTGAQAQLFYPTDYVDITDVAELKRKACDCHVSQGMDHIYEVWHDTMEKFRGIEFHCDRAEAFIHLRRSGNDIFEE